MGRPVWITKPGDLGVISERQFYNLRFDVDDPDDGALTYTLVGGSLPIGLSLKDDGFIEGIPTIRKVFIRGVPVDVAEDVTNTFAVRVATETGDVADRTFTITVSGQDVPVITSTETDLGSYFDGTWFEYQLTAVDADSDELSWYVKEGDLPTGLSLDPTTGIISGFLNVTVDPTQNEAGWVSQVYDNDPWDFSVRSLSQYFQFTIGVTDGKDDAIKEYKLYVISKDGMTADSTTVTTDAVNIITADVSNKRNPVITTLDTDLGVVVHDNYFAFKVEATDFDGDRIQFVADNAGLDTPPGLAVNTETGWITGYIPVQSTLEAPYQYGVRAVKRDYVDTYSSERVVFDIIIVNDIGKFVTWDSDTLLGVVDNGEYSTLQVSAHNDIGTEFKYRLADNYGQGTYVDPLEFNFTGDGSSTVFETSVFNLADFSVSATIPASFTIEQNSIVFSSPVSNGTDFTIKVDYQVDTETSELYSSGKLPNGLKLLENGLISGRLAFNSFSIDGGRTTFDVEERRITSTSEPTSFDVGYDFTVEAYDQSGTINSHKTFRIEIDLVNNVPYDNLYIKGHLDRSDREMFDQLLSDTTVFVEDMLYRPEDPFFGKASSIRSLVAVGLNPETPEQLQKAVSTNHYNKRINLGDIKTARATDDDGNVVYEVVYYEVRDDKVTESGESISSEIQLGNIAISGGFDNIIYPNSLQNMRNAVYDHVEQSNPNAMPLWMRSKQVNGLIPGLVDAVVICYTKPGYSDDIAFKLRRSGIDLTELNIVVDRYIWDNNLSDFYDFESKSFIASAETTFDKFINGSPFVTIAGSVDYATDRPYVEINGRSIIEIVTTGGIDSVTNAELLVGKTVIFAKQENYEGYVGYDDPWSNFTSKFAEVGFDEEPFDQMDYIPGEYDSDNERTGIYRIVLDSSNVVNLELVTTVDNGDGVDVAIGGVKYGGNRLLLDPTVEPGNTVPAYSPIEGLTQGIQTTLDNNGTRFFAYKDVYTIPDAEDSYIKFPQIGVFK